MNLYAAFFIGLAGSLHCAAMCGPLVLALSAARRNSSAAGSWPWLYHAGRVLTYMVLGATSGAAGSVFLQAGWQRGLSIAAGTAVMGGAFLLLRGGAAGSGGRLNLWIRNRFGFFLRDRSSGATVCLGALNGLLPCGLVYLAVATAAAAGSVAGGMATMLAFAAGTLPMMVGINLAGRVFAWVSPVRWRGVVVVCAGLAGLLLIARGMALGIPYVSPASASGVTGSCCQPAAH